MCLSSSKAQKNHFKHTRILSLSAHLMESARGWTPSTQEPSAEPEPKDWQWACNVFNCWCKTVCMCVIHVWQCTKVYTLGECICCRLYIDRKVFQRKPTQYTNWGYSQSLDTELLWLGLRVASLSWAQPSLQSSLLPGVTSRPDPRCRADAHTEHH